jgi:hypothetical protein
MPETDSIYRISFINHGEIYEVFCRNVYQADMYGFVVIEDFVFGERSSVVVDPSEERLKDEFSGVKRTYIPMHAVIRMDEVERQGQSRIKEMDSKVAAFPGIYGGIQPGNKDG